MATFAAQKRAIEIFQRVWAGPDRPVENPRPWSGFFFKIASIRSIPVLNKLLSTLGLRCRSGVPRRNREIIVGEVLRVPNARVLRTVIGECVWRAQPTTTLTKCKDIRTKRFITIPALCKMSRLLSTSFAFRTKNPLRRLRF